MKLELASFNHVCEEMISMRRLVSPRNSSCYDVPVETFTHRTGVTSSLPILWNNACSISTLRFVLPCTLAGPIDSCVAIRTLMVILLDPTALYGWDVLNRDGLLPFAACTVATIDLHFTRDVRCVSLKHSIAYIIGRCILLVCWFKSISVFYCRDGRRRWHEASSVVKVWSVNWVALHVFEHDPLPVLFFLLL